MPKLTNRKLAETVELMREEWIDHIEVNGHLDPDYMRRSLIRRYNHCTIAQVTFPFPGGDVEVSTTYRGVEPEGTRVRLARKDETLQRMDWILMGEIDADEDPYGTELPCEQGSGYVR